MVGIDECDDFASARIGSCEFYRRIIGIRAAVAENDFRRHTTGINRGQSFCIFNAFFAIGISDGILGIVLKLLLHRCGYHRVTASQVQRGGTGKKINKLIIVLIINHIPVNFFNHQRIIGQVLCRRYYLLVSFHQSIAFFRVQSHCYHSLLLPTP